MFQYQCLNPISKVGLDGFTNDYTKTEEIEKAATKKTAKAKETPAERPTNSQRNGERKRKLTFKEAREMEALEADIEALEAEKKAIEEALCSGTLSTAELTEKSVRLPRLTEELEEKSMRWLELAEWA